MPLPGLVRARARAGRAAAAGRSRARAVEAQPAEVDPVARVLVDVPLAHLDRPFDYAVPAAMADAAVPGARVKVRFAGQEVAGYVLERAAASQHAGRLAPLRRVVSPEPVLAPEVAELTATVARRCAGTRADVLRLAVPPRHATAEREPSTAAPAAPRPAGDAPGAAGWAAYAQGAGLLTALAAGASPRAVWTAAPGEDWPALLAAAAAAALSAGRGSVLCVPDGKDVDRLDAALGAALGEGHHVALRADAGPARRYRDYLAVRRGARRVVVGTRAAAFAPVHDLGLVVVWDDGDDLHAEPRAPYPHTRETLLLRAAQQGTAVVVGGFARTVEAQYLLRTGWAREVTAPREEVRRRVTVTVAGASEHDLVRDPFARTARVPRQAHDLVRRGLAHGPVLVQTPRAGYAGSLACERCRTPARCEACTGPLRLTGSTRPPACRWCGRAHPAWRCGTCGHRGLRAPVVGEARTAEELGRTFAPVPVRSSGGDHVLARVPETPAVVVATPGAEPVADGGYAAVLLLDGWLALARPDLRTAEEALRRWTAAVGLVRPGGEALLVADPALPVVQALVRWDAGGFAERETAERREAHLPPASRIATVTGRAAAVEEVAALLRLPAGAEALGPVPVDLAGPGPGTPPAGTPAVSVGDREVRLVLRVPRAQGAALSDALGEVQRLRSARKLEAVRVQVDPPSL
nr:primosomal protein N' [Nocardioides perillae]